MQKLSMLLFIVLIVSACKKPGVNKDTPPSLPVMLYTGFNDIEVGYNQLKQVDIDHGQNRFLFQNLSYLRSSS